MEIRLQTFYGVILRVLLLHLKQIIKYFLLEQPHRLRARLFFPYAGDRLLPLQFSGAFFAGGGVFLRHGSLYAAMARMRGLVLRLVSSGV